MLRVLLISVWSALTGLCLGYDVVITESTAVGADETSLEGLAVLVDGAELTLDGVHRLARLDLTNAAVVTHTAEWVDGMRLYVAGDMTVGSNSAVNVSGKGYAGGGEKENGGGPGGGVYGLNGSGGGAYGGAGGVGSGGYGVEAAGGEGYGFAYGPMMPGSGGAAYNPGCTGGNGGGLLVLQVGGVLTLDGEICADGTMGTADIWSPPGSGAGGGIWIWADAVTGAGQLHACGADGPTGMYGYRGGPGSGGRVALFASTLSFATSGVSVAAGAAGVTPAEAGSVVVSTNIPAEPPGAPTVNDLLPMPATNWVQTPTVTIRGSRSDDSAIWFNDQCVVPWGAGNWQVPIRLEGECITVDYYAMDMVGHPSPTNTFYLQRDPDYVFIMDDTHIAVDDTTYESRSLVVDGATLMLDGHHVFSSLALMNGATMTHSSAVTGLVFTVMGDLLVASNASITVEGLGYAGGRAGSLRSSGEGPGGGAMKWYTGGGGSHGGAGGTSSDYGSGGACYGRDIYPITPGSGGGGTYAYGGGMPGGGCIWIRAEGRITVDGTVDASGVGHIPGSRLGGGAGAGGSILICGAWLSGSGYIDASGGDGCVVDARYGGGGGGGRIAIYAPLDGFALTHVSVAGGAVGSPVAEPGSLIHVAGVLPAIIDDFSISEYVTQAVESFTLTFTAPLDPATVALDDFVMTGPQACALQSTEMVDDSTVMVRLASALEQDGVYTITVGPHIASSLGGEMDGDGDGVGGEGPDDASLLTFTIDRTPPAAPVVTNFTVAPYINVVTSSLPVISGLKDADATVICESRAVTAESGTVWSNRTLIDVGSSRVSLVARDPAGNESDPTELCFLCDMLRPQVLSGTPTNGAVVMGQPSITVTCADSASGPDLANSLFVVDSGGEPVSGVWALGSGATASFAPESNLATGRYQIVAIACDRAGMMSEPYVVSFEIANPPLSYADCVPVWWCDRGLLDCACQSTNDYAALNVGQLKWTARCAADTLDADTAFGAGPEIHALIDSFTNSQNGCAANVGQLKAVAAPFYDWLGLPLPWPDAPGSNAWNVVNVGQLKHVFDLPIGEDADGNGIDDWWELARFGSNVVQSADSDGDGLSNLEEFENRSLPDVADSDMDGVSDGQEVLYGSDPADAFSFPVDVSGTVAYGGDATGAVYVVASHVEEGWSGKSSRLTDLPSPFVISNVVSGQATWIKAFRDVNANTICERWEPVGVAEGGPCTLVQTSNGFDITLMNPDLDGDGMDDLWEVRMFGSTAADPADDADGDGVTNLEEFIQQTDPLQFNGSGDGISYDATVVTGEVGLTVFTPID